MRDHTRDWLSENSLLVADVNTLKGTTGDDDLTGTTGKDKFVLSQGGNDTAQGLAGNDNFFMGAALNAADRINGGNGNDVVTLAGDYSAGLTFQAKTMINVETLKVANGFSYDLTLNNSTVAAGATLTVDASALDAMHFISVRTGNQGTFHLIGGASEDNFFVANFTTADQVDGGGDTDNSLSLSGDYTGANALTFTASMLKNVQSLELNGGHSYNITTTDATVSAGQTMSVASSSLSNTDTLTFNGAAETDGRFVFFGGDGNDVLTGGTGADLFNLGEFTVWDGGNDRASGGAGNDTFIFGQELNAQDRVNGGAGSDIVVLQGEYSGKNALHFSATTMTNVEMFSLENRGNYDITTNDATVAKGKTLFVDADKMQYGTILDFDGSAETDGKFVIHAGAGNDFIVGGARDDVIDGGGGADVLEGGRGHNTFMFTAAANSSSVFFDTIVDFDASKDSFSVNIVPTAVTTTTTGSLSLATFDSDLSNALFELGPHQATIFTPSGGDYVGKQFLIVDENGNTGYQAGEDLVISLSNNGSTGTITTGNFVASIS